MGWIADRGSSIFLPQMIKNRVLVLAILTWRRFKARPMPNKDVVNHNEKIWRNVFGCFLSKVANLMCAKRRPEYNVNIRFKSSFTYDPAQADKSGLNSIIDVAPQTYACSYRRISYLSRTV